MKKFGDRKDAKLVRKIDSLHYATSIIYPNRTDNEIFLSQKINLTNINQYIKEKNISVNDKPYNVSQIIIIALLKTFVIRPDLNRFIVNRKHYMRNKITASFIVKRQLTDTAEEGFVNIEANKDSNIDSIKAEIDKQIKEIRSGKLTDTDKAMALMNRLPHFITTPVLKFFTFLDRHGKLPISVYGTDPYCCSMLITNLGSVGLDNAFHHLTNWGTTSFVCAIGKKGKTPVYNNNGFDKMIPTINLSFTVDERISDGYYFAKSIRIFNRILKNPQCLEKPFFYTNI